ncbi:phosphatase PAP2 family protein [Nocardia sp. CA-145437]|uniref:phosphatase PAP2 family protein n=1 Tax=Nocardia sp. CA-145437 TaxID=3239980 RepID=UPI003D963262
MTTRAGWWPRPGLVSITVMIVLAAWVAAIGELTDNVVDRDGLTRIDPGWLGWVIAHRAPDLTAIARLLSDAGDTMSMLAVALTASAVLAWRRRWNEVATVIVATAGAGALVLIGKHVVGRSRPPVVDHLVTETNQSFPSGHSLSSLVVLGAVVAIAVTHLRVRALRMVLVALTAGLIAAIGWSRLYLGVHWPTDILAGWLVGGLWLTACLMTAHRIRRREQDRAVR